MDTAGVTRGREEAEEADVYVVVVVVQSDMFQLSERSTGEGAVAPKRDNETCQMGSGSSCPVLMLRGVQDVVS